MRKLNADRQRSKQRVYIGEHFQTWNQLRKDLGFDYHHKLAGFLLEFYFHAKKGAPPPESSSLQTSIPSQPRETEYCGRVANSPSSFHEADTSQYPILLPSIQETAINVFASSEKESPEVTAKRVPPSKKKIPLAIAQNTTSHQKVTPKSTASSRKRSRVAIPRSTDLCIEEGPEDDLKPPFSYAQLIYQAIMSTEDQQVTLSGIYDYIKNTYPYYRRAEEQGWKNSVRHVLSLQSCFMKVPQLEDASQKGSFWRLDVEKLSYDKLRRLQEKLVRRRKPLTKRSLPTSSNHTVRTFKLINKKLCGKKNPSSKGLEGDSQPAPLLTAGSPATSSQNSASKSAIHQLPTVNTVPDIVISNPTPMMLNGTSEVPLLSDESQMEIKEQINSSLQGKLEATAEELKPVLLVKNLTFGQSENMDIIQQPDLSLPVTSSGPQTLTATIFSQPVTSQEGENTLFPQLTLPSLAPQQQSLVPKVTGIPVTFKLSNPDEESLENNDQASGHIDVNEIIIEVKEEETEESEGEFY
ncbi:forkhead box protein K2-like [Saccostrea echinata]|uniref:forkhead box protein K2-like n=1 Tax=Saccostrea echinata TaxID=191078 RepID=UPI002A7F9E93|nr:forkhead box protein K2-like [Saccostrea echinata]